VRRDEVPVSLEGIEEWFPEDPELRSRAQTAFYKRLALETHREYRGAMQTMPRAGLFGFNWFNALYSPGVSSVSTAIRDDPDLSFELSSRGNTVAVVSDSTRVLGDGDCGPSGGLGVMEGKAFLMKYLGGVDAVALCVDSRGPDGSSDPDRVIDFVRMAQASFGAVNLEDISQPNCYRILDELQTCGIPVWHDDAQGTACVTLAGAINALRVMGKPMAEARFALLGAGAANTAIARFLIAAGADPERIALADHTGPLHAGRADYEADPRFYRQWELCRATNPKRIGETPRIFEGADVAIALSKPGPGVLPPSWVGSMAKGCAVFACANPVPEIWPHEAKAAGAAVVATGRGDFPNQVNNSVCFPGLLKGVLLARARSVSDGMAIACAREIADYAARRGLSPDAIMPTMEDTELFAIEAGAVAERAAQEGLARRAMPRDEASALARADIEASRASYRALVESGCVRPPSQDALRRALDGALRDAGAGV
jgi:malate dehydrogenase (oxaloacetate-decarboxylating)